MIDVFYDAVLGPSSASGEALPLTRTVHLAPHFDSVPVNWGWPMHMRRLYGEPDPIALMSFILQTTT
jgi:hypothetical protein